MSIFLHLLVLAAPALDTRPSTAAKAIPLVSRTRPASCARS
jgi:hypothetical protein